MHVEVFDKSVHMEKYQYKLPHLKKMKFKITPNTAPFNSV